MVDIENRVKALDLTVFRWMSLPTKYRPIFDYFDLDHCQMACRDFSGCKKGMGKNVMEKGQACLSSFKTKRFHHLHCTIAN